MASTVHGPQSVGQLGPFWPNPMRPRGHPISPQGQVGPKPQLGPPEPNLAPNPIKPKMAIKTFRTQFWSLTTMDHFSAHGLLEPPEATRSA
ncbi:hypothetical protein O181_132477 [Austropuccinia psidii MF-1]|uniref:Uncharacterized protein n=1 Tax=Austropuccinia psidii MF-1 TaxID=1389203 RepID=A0A9Q3QDW9_9BASI|nr:hypothetical protein [Austropuccinia psidii MF-1]